MCAICQTPFVEGELAGRCPGCEAPFHEDCWGENGGCATYGCGLMPETVKPLDAAPQSYWGQEEKDCPRCSRPIRVAALRCRHCGAVFETTAPQSRTEVAAQRQDADSARGAKRAAVLLFLLGIVPCAAPLGLAFGLPWALASRRTIARLPATHRVLCGLGLIAAALSTLALGLVALMRPGGS